MNNWKPITEEKSRYRTLQVHVEIAAVNKCDVTCYYKSAVAEMGDRLATVDMGRKEGGAAGPLS